MNVFVLDKDPAKAAQYHCDKHVNKMIVEHLQMMSIVAVVNDLDPAKRTNGEFYKTRRLCTGKEIKKYILPSRYPHSSVGSKLIPNFLIN